jgi:hypothetical protein
MRRALRFVLALALALPGLSCEDSPTGPAGSGGAGFLVLTAAAPPTISGSGVLTLEPLACTCATGPLLVFVNGASAGSTACAGRKDFPMPAMEAGTARSEVRVTDATGPTGLLVFNVTSDTPGAPSLTVRALCP